ncbi:hypothetical protein SESBI_24151 [Sesbania bispinosa]|nr:hypothetical protein SESBI_24151 [Sesbania bispinosa]
MAPPPADLRKIGLEGFALIDKFFGPPRRSLAAANDANFNGRRERSWVVYQVPNGEMEQPFMNSNEAAIHYGGISVVSNNNHPKGKPQNRWGRPIKP